MHFDPMEGRSNSQINHIWQDARASNPNYPWVYIGFLGFTKGLKKGLGFGV